MAKKPETVFKDRIRPWLNKIPSSWWECIQQESIRGTPDFLGCINGTFIALELKKDDKEVPKPLQLHKLNKITKAGGVALVVTPQNWKNTYERLLSIK